MGFHCGKQLCCFVMSENVNVHVAQSAPYVLFQRMFTSVNICFLVMLHHLAVCSVSMLSRIRTGAKETGTVLLTIDHD